MDTPTAQDLREFRQYCKQCTDSQLKAVFEKERDAKREHYADIAWAELDGREWSHYHKIGY